MEWSAASGVEIGSMELWGGQSHPLTIGDGVATAKG